eukprot:1270928-Alexandrium_andersonii.AAC.1
MAVIGSPSHRLAGHRDRSCPQPGWVAPRTPGGSLRPSAGCAPPGGRGACITTSRGHADEVGDL